MIAKPEHQPEGDPCARCGRAATDHRARRERRRPDRRDDRAEDERCVFLGIDGEGQGRAPHRYTLMGCSDELGERSWVLRPKEGFIDLSTVECLEFICSLPARHAKIFAYSFNYDLTMILRDVDDRALYRLFRPDLRRGEHGPKPEYWQTTLEGDEPVTYGFNLLATKFSVSRSIGREVREVAPGVFRPKMGRATTIYDVWKFFQGRFTAALTDWKIGTPEAVARMEEMKRKRSEFDKVSNEAIEAYCLDECRYMAELARKLTDAHDNVGLKLKSYFGAGSSASAMLDAMGLKSHVKESRVIRANDSVDLETAIASAFFGGRFENSRTGKIAGPVYSADISSAYPYELCFLPCLLHGKWRRTKNRSIMERARAAVVRYALDEPARPKEAAEAAWAPFPFRVPDGSIVYPRASGGGWIWREEFLAGERLFPNAHMVEAWAYECQCGCVPFAEIPRYYRERVRIGKEGPGIVIKLGCNSCYGKLAQSVGGQLGAYTVWMWAGLITSGTRMKILSDALGGLENHADLLMTATDGVCSRVPIAMPAPRDTGTYDCRNQKGELVPLGGWEQKTLSGGLFLARPGIYFQPTERSEEELKYVRGRGVGRAAMVQNARRIMDAYEAGERSVHVTSLDRFVGAKTGISRSKKKPSDPGRGQWRYKRSVVFGDWVDRPIEMSFDPLPKREGVGPDGVLGLRAFPNLTSLPYRQGTTASAEATLLRALAAEALEQPDCDFGELSDYEED